MCVLHFWFHFWIWWSPSFVLWSYFSFQRVAYQSSSQLIKLSPLLLLSVYTTHNFLVRRLIYYGLVVHPLSFFYSPAICPHSYTQIIFFDAWLDLWITKLLYNSTRWEYVSYMVRDDFICRVVFEAEQRWVAISKCSFVAYKRRETQSQTDLLYFFP